MELQDKLNYNELADLLERVYQITNEIKEKMIPLESRMCKGVLASHNIDFWDWKEEEVTYVSKLLRAMAPLNETSNGINHAQVEY